MRLTLKQFEKFIGMEKQIQLYPPVKVTGRSFKKVKRQTVPNQSMTLKMILQRFVKRESLPMLRDGVYEERFGDLEKMKHADITEQLETAESLKKSIDDYKKREKAKRDKAAAAAAPPSSPSTPSNQAGEGKPA